LEVVKGRKKKKKRSSLFLEKSNFTPTLLSGNAQKGEKEEQVEHKRGGKSAAIVFGNLAEEKKKKKSAFSHPLGRLDNPSIAQVFHFKQPVGGGKKPGAHRFASPKSAGVFPRYPVKTREKNRNTAATNRPDVEAGKWGLSQVPDNPRPLSRKGERKGCPPAQLTHLFKKQEEKGFSLGHNSVLPSTQDWRRKRGSPPAALGGRGWERD